MSRIVHVVNRADGTTVPWQMASRMRDRGVDVSIVAWYGELGGAAPGTGLGARRWWDLRAAGRLVAHLRAVGPDVVHLHHTASAAVAAVAARRAGRPAVVKTEHSSRARKRPGQYALDLVSLTLSDAVVANSGATLASFPPWERALTRHKSRRIYNGVDLEAIDAAGEEAGRGGRGRRGDEAVVLSVGRLVAEKNHGTLLRAAGIALEGRGASFRLVLLGDGRRRTALEERARELGISDRVDFRGEVGREEVYRQLARSDVFVVPSLSEGFCNAAVEAMAAGLPVLASDVPALREVVGEDGRYFDPRRPEEIADSIVSVLSGTEGRRRRVGEALRARARERFSLDRTVDEHLRLYRELVERRADDGSQ